MKENLLWHKKTAECWDEAHPLGNGKLGIMVFGGTAGIIEMFWQSQDGIIDVVPALPDV